MWNRTYHYKFENMYCIIVNQIRTGFEEGTTTAIEEYKTNDELSGALNKTQEMVSFHNILFEVLIKFIRIEFAVDS